MYTVNTFAARFRQKEYEADQECAPEGIDSGKPKKSGIRLQGIGEKTQHAFPCANRRTFLHRNRPMCGSK